MDRTDSQKIMGLIEAGEGTGVEFKRAASSIPETFWESYSAFANTDGGVIVLGITEDPPRVYTITGVTDADKLVSDFWNTVHGDKVSANICFERDVNIVDVEDKKVVIIEVPRAPRENRPVYVGADVFKGSFRRNADGDYKCSEAAVKAMLRDQCAETADTMLVEELSIADLDADTIARYRRRFANLKPDHVWNQLDDEEFLLKIGAARRLRDGGTHPTLAGLVCFGDYNTITNVIGDYFLDYRERGVGDKRWTDRVSAQDGTWSGNIYDFYCKVRDRITGDVKSGFGLEPDGFTSVEEDRVRRGIREVLANALLHTDYHGTRGIVIEKLPGELRFSNPGLMRVSRSEAIAGGASDARNVKIFNILSLVRIGERSGMGLADMFDAWKEQGWATPEVSESYEPERTSVRLLLEADDKRTITDDKRTITDDKRTVTDDKRTINDTQRKEKGLRSWDELPATARQVYLQLEQDNAATYEALAGALHLGRTAISEAIGSLVKHEFIRRIGANKNGRWALLGK